MLKKKMKKAEKEKKKNMKKVKGKKDKKVKSKKVKKEKLDAEIEAMLLEDLNSEEEVIETRESTEAMKALEEFLNKSESDKGGN